MNLLLALGLGFAIGFLAQRKRAKRLKMLLRATRHRIMEQEEIISLQLQQIELQRQAFESLLKEFNHEGPIPNSATALGMIGLTLSAILRCITEFKKLLAEKDYHTAPFITELEGIVAFELRVIYTKLEDFLTSRRRLMHKYHRFQDEEQTSTWKPTTTDMASSSSVAST